MSKLFDLDKEEKIYPLYKWAGGKRRLWKHYKDIILKKEHHSTYIEPFFGGGAIFCEMSDKFDNLIINDINSEIIGIYNSIKNNLENFLGELKKFSEEYLEVPDRDSRKEHYYKMRRVYWETKDSSLLYLLMKLSFNGLWQINKESNGLFATPAGNLHHKVIEDIYDENNIRNWNKVLQRTTILNGSYDKVPVPANSVIFLDPPYRASFTTYGIDFGDEKQEKLVKWAQSKIAKDSSIEIFESNRCVEGDTFFEDLIPNGEFTYIDITYTVGRRKKEGEVYKAKKAKEFLVKF